LRSLAARSSISCVTLPGGDGRLAVLDVGDCWTSWLTRWSASMSAPRSADTVWLRSCAFLPRSCVGGDIEMPLDGSVSLTRSAVKVGEGGLRAGGNVRCGRSNPGRRGGRLPDNATRSAVPLDRHLIGDPGQLKHWAARGAARRARPPAASACPAHGGGGRDTRWAPTKSPRCRIAVARQTHRLVVSCADELGVGGDAVIDRRERIARTQPQRAARARSASSQRPP